MRPLHKFPRADGGGASVEFVALMFPFMLITFFVIEVGVATFWAATAEKAAQVGVRLAIVGDPAVGVSACPSSGAAEDGMPLENCRVAATVIYGTSCAVASVCAPWGPIECAGGASADCDAVAFAAITARIQAVFAPAEDENITIRYTDSRLGYAGGPTIPLVTVEISGVPYDLVLTGIMATFFGDDSAFVTMPTVSATLTGEDLSGGGTV